MNTSNFTTSFVVEQTPEEVFAAINNVRGWWSEEIEGHTNKLHDEFMHHFENVHYCKLKIVEFVPNEKIVWLVTYNYFKFTKNTSEWTGTKIVFDISSQEGKTKIRFTHEGLVPEYECFNICSNAWTQFIQESLKDLITTGKGQPTSADNPKTEDEKKLGSGGKTKQDYRVSLTVDASLHEVFNSINDVTKWWTEDLTGHSQQLLDEFTVRFGDVHVSTQKLVGFIPDKKVVWLVTDSKLNFIQDKSEWTGTTIIFELSSQGNKTRLDFTHQGLVPAVECYQMCVQGWDKFVKGSLYKLLTEGVGEPGYN